MMGRSFHVLLGCFILGAAEPPAACDLPAEVGTEAVMHASMLSLEDTVSSMCCSWGGGACADCGTDGTGWCHLSKENCEDVCGPGAASYIAGTPPSCPPPTPAPSPVLGYAVSPSKTTSCGDLSYNDIASAADCQAAAMAGKGAGLNWNWDGTRDWPDRLPGCLYCEPYGDVNFNINPAGQGISDDQVPLCALPGTDFDSTTGFTPSSAVGDPHVVTSRGFKLDLNQPGDYTLLQVPYDGPPLLRLEATVERSGTSCTFYVTKVRFLGTWFHEDILKIRAETHAPSLQEGGWPFAIQMADAKPWTSLADISSKNETVLKTYKHADVEVKVTGLPQITKGMDSHKSLEGYFSILVAKPGQTQAEQTIIKIAKGERWLNIALTRLGNLGYSKMGGVLGTDVPNAKWTELPDDCKMFHELQGEDKRQKDTSPGFEPNSDASISWY